MAVDTTVSTEGLIASDLFDFLPLAVERLMLGDGDEDEDHDHDHDHDHDRPGW
jgi:ABC-type Zn2+ transport system substrate-binding protein/surface adhesin